MEFQGRTSPNEPFRIQKGGLARIQKMGDRAVSTGSIDHANFHRADGATVRDPVCRRAAVCDGTKASLVFSGDVHEVRIQRKHGFRRGVVRDHSNACTQGFRGFVSGHSMSALDEKSE